MSPKFDFTTFKDPCLSFNWRYYEPGKVAWAPKDLGGVSCHPRQHTILIWFNILFLDNLFSFKCYIYYYSIVRYDSVFIAFLPLNCII